MDSRAVWTPPMAGSLPLRLFAGLAIGPFGLENRDLSGVAESMASAARPTTEKYCIIGAGASGLAAAKNLSARGIPFDCLERAHDIGGLWNIGTPSGVVYETTHLVSSRKYTSFDDFPMDPEAYPQYPSHSRIMGYFRDYVEKFGLLPSIELGKTAERLTPAGDKWSVKVAGETSARLYRGVVIANGHHFAPRLPKIPGDFSGTIIHSRDYRSPKQLRDKRVLVVGTGNSGCDIAVDGVHNAQRLVLSMRRGAWFVPKFMLGFPTNGAVAFLEAVPMPRWLRRALFEMSHFVLAGPAARFGLPKPEYRIDESHPTMSDEIPRLVQHGRIIVKPAIERFDRNSVVFSDGSSEELDLIVFATGYEAGFEFIDPETMLRDDGRARLYLNVFHPVYDNLFAVGLIQANGSIWRLADLQSQLVASFIVAAESDTAKAAWFRDLKSAGGPAEDGPRFVRSDRHRFEVNFYDYRRRLRRLLKRFGASATARFPRTSAAAEDATRAHPMAAE